MTLLCLVATDVTIANTINICHFDESRQTLAKVPKTRHRLLDHQRGEVSCNQPILQLGHPDPTARCTVT